MTGSISKQKWALFTGRGNLPGSFRLVSGMAFLAGAVLGLGSVSAQAALVSDDYDIYTELSGLSGRTSLSLTAQLGITIDSSSQTTWTLLNTTPATSWSGNPNNSDQFGTGVGDPPRIDALFFGLVGFPLNFQANDLDMTVLAVSDSQGWTIDDASNTNSGGGGKFALVNEIDDPTDRLGINKTLVFTLSTTAFTWSRDTFLSALGSTGGNGGWQVGASFQTVGRRGSESGIATADYREGDRLVGDPTPAPEPETLALLAIGLLGARLARKRLTSAA